MRMLRAANSLPRVSGFRHKYGMNARKCALGLVCGIVITWATVPGNQLAPASSLSISAKEIGSSGATAYRWMTSWGSYDCDFFTQQDVQIEAHNLSRLPARILINFYFVGQPEHKSEPRKLFSERSFTIDVPPPYHK